MRQLRTELALLVARRPVWLLALLPLLAAVPLAATLAVGVPSMRLPAALALAVAAAGILLGAWSADPPPTVPAVAGPLLPPAHQLRSLAASAAAVLVAVLVLAGVVTAGYLVALAVLTSPADLPWAGLLGQTARGIALALAAATAGFALAVLVRGPVPALALVLAYLVLEVAARTALVAVRPGGGEDWLLSRHVLVWLHGGAGWVAPTAPRPVPPVVESGLVLAAVVAVLAGAAVAACGWRARARR